MFGQICGGNLTDASGQITSPDIDGFSDPLGVCKWTILAENKTIELHIVRINIRNIRDIYSGGIKVKMICHRKHAKYTVYIPVGMGVGAWVRGG